MNRTLLAAAVVLVFTRSLWSVEPAPMLVTENMKAVAQGGNALAADLYAQLRAPDSANLFFSPYSISTALAMASAGAEGPTKAQMDKVLHLPPLDGQLQPAVSSLRKLLLADDKSSGFRLRVANRLWGQAGFQFVPDFLRVMKDDYGAELGVVDFKQAEAARRTINTWVEEQTDDKIQNLLAPGVLHDDTRLVLTNAIYFKARWLHEFSKAATKDAAFHAPGRRELTVATMHQKHRLNYGAWDDLQVLELPYAGGGDLSMLILLPRKVDGLRDLEARLTAESLQTWSSGLQERLVDVSLPKFKMTSEFSLADVLATLGMPLAFSRQADFSGISTQEKLFISAVIHKAFVDVNEEGTEAAAATAIAIGAMAMRPLPEQPVEFRADHPFVLLIRDRRTEAVLFLGRVTNPQAQAN